MRCIVNGCEATHINGQGPSFHKLYQNGAFKEEWIAAIRKYNNQVVDRLSRYPRICSSHFKESHIRNLGSRLHLEPNAVPTIFPMTGKAIAMNQSSNSNASTPKSSDQKSGTLPVDECYGTATRTVKRSCRLKHRLVEKAKLLNLIQRQLERHKKHKGKLTNTIFGLQRFRPDKRNRSPRIVQHQTTINNNGRRSKNT